ncbi:MAG: hypothetical protein COW55_11935 [Rhodobacteraceae bacterium CG17_big_fil_post_rev_8_21_14_2_50_65_11]|nr:MAG: hypothetical protein COW55_11935 [Rhodobacteraceae bacterium CG17_big_fil_post_rev_8_21_14_2_50_65_11]
MARSHFDQCDILFQPYLKIFTLSAKKCIIVIFFVLASDLHRVIVDAFARVFAGAGKQRAMTQRPERIGGVEKVRDTILASSARGRNA